MVLAAAGHWAFVPNSLPPALDFPADLVTLLTDAERALGELAGVGQTLPNPHLLIRPFIDREAVLSSRIEGTLTTLDQLLLFEVEPDELRHPADAQEVRNYVRAVDHGLTEVRGGRPLDLELIRELHRILLTGVRGSEKRPGQFRDRPVFLGTRRQTIHEARFVPPCPERLPELHDGFDRFVREGRSLPALVHLAVMHYGFEAIHPFNDGNGRVGRLLITLTLCERGLLPQPLLYLSAYFEANRREYYDGLLEVSRRGEWSEWIAFVAAGVAEQARDVATRARRLLDVWQDFRPRAVAAVRSPVVLRLVDELFASPYLTVNRAAAVTGASRAAAHNTVAKLAAAGLLREITGKRRNRVYCADAILHLLDAPMSNAP